MKKLLVLMLGLLSLTTHAAEVREGLWDLSALMHVEGQNYGPYNRQQCITKEDVQNPAHLFGETTGTCDFTNKHFFGNQFSFNVHCNAGIPLSGTGEVEYGSDWIKGHMELSAQVSGGPSVETVSEISGKRLGDCSK